MSEDDESEDFEESESDDFEDEERVYESSSCDVLHNE